MACGGTDEGEKEDEEEKNKMRLIQVWKLNDYEETKAGEATGSECRGRERQD